MGLHPIISIRKSTRNRDILYALKISKALNEILEPEDSRESSPQLKILFVSLTMDELRLKTSSK